MQKESDIERRLTNKIKELGGLSLKWTSPGTDGVPDRIVILPKGRIYFVELKTDTGKLSQIQRYQIRRLKDLDCRVRVIYGMQGLEVFLDEIDI